MRRRAIALARILVLAALGLSGATARQAILWNELHDGDLSDNRFAPTPFLAAEGDNELFGFLGGDNGMGGLDRDYYSLTIPAGFVLSQIVLEAYFSDDDVAFLGVQPGPIFPDDPATVQPGDLLGWIHFGPPEIDHDMLAVMSTHGRTFTPPLGAGIYSFWCQQTGDGTEYAMDFVVEPVPAPGAIPMAAALAAFALRRRGR